jgi:hypothetical protein
MRARWGVGVMAVGAVIASAVAAHAAPAHLPDPDPPTAITVATPAATPADLVGVWQRRDAYLLVGPTGTARFRWQTQACGPGIADPCDRDTPEGVLLGAHAEIGLVGSATGVPVAQVDGTVVSVTPTGLFATGPVSLVRIADDLIELRQSDRHIELCRPPRELNFCDVLL